MQHYAEEAAVKQMKEVQKTFNQHWGNVNPWQDERHIEIPHFIEDIAKKLPVYRMLSQKYDGNQDSIDYYLNLPHPVKLFDYENGFVEKEISTLDSIRYMEHFMHCGFVAIEPQTGHVKAWVGDVDFKTWKYDKVTAMRQPGSTFKLFVYSEAMNQGITPCDTRKDEYFAMKVMDHGKEVTWAPTNADGHFSNMNITLKQAFAMSINSVAVRLGQEVGIDRIVRTAHDMGIKSKLDPTPSLTLGASDVNLLELVSSYCTPVNDGKAIDPVLVTKIEDREGNVIYEANAEPRQALSPKSAFYVQQLLMGGMSGTSSRLRGFVGNANNQQPLRCLVRRHHAAPRLRCMGRWRIPLHPFPHRPTRTRQPHGTAHLRLFPRLSPQRQAVQPVPHPVQETRQHRRITRRLRVWRLLHGTGR